MKKSEAIKLIAVAMNAGYGNSFENDLDFPAQTMDLQVAALILKQLEDAGMTPKPYIHPRAIAEGLDDPKWGYIQYIDKYPEHHFTYKNPRPYEYYVEGWEPEA